MRRIVCLLAFLAAATAGGQVREQVTVEVIEVPVYVSDSNGQPVRGLTKDLFVLRVNGRQQPIEYFDVIDFAAPSGGAFSPLRRPARERRLYLLLFDVANSLPGFLARAQRAAHYAVDQSNPNTDFFAIATYMPNKGVQFASAFVSDRAAIQRAIQTLSISEARDPLAIALSPAERTDWSTGARMESESLDQLKGSEANQQMLRQPATYRIEDLLGNFSDLASRLARLEGQKHVLYLSTGFDAVPATDDARTVHFLNEMFESFRAAGVFLDAVDIAGVRSKWDNTTQMKKVREVDPGTDDPAFAMRQLRDALHVNDSLQMISSGTGGQFIHDQNDLSKGLTDLETVQQVVYVLGFNRHGSRGGDISVRVKGLSLGTRVSYRQGFGTPTKQKSVDPLELADILINDVPQSGLTLPIRANGNDIEVMIPTAQVLPQLVEKTPFVDLLIYVFDDRGSAIEGMQKRIRFDDALKRSAGPIVVRKHFDMPPGRYVVKAIARIEGTTSLGFARAELTVK